MAILAVLIAAAAMLFGAPASAQEWPTRPITLVVASTPGSMMDFISRSLAQDMSVTLGQPVVVEFKSGAGGVIGTQAVAKAAPDGYTILQVNTGAMVFHPMTDKAASYTAEKDFTAISLIGDSPNAVLVNPKIGVKTIKDLLAYADTKQRKLNMAHPGPGTMGQYCGALLARETKIDGNFISYRGSAGIVTDLMGGQVDVGTPVYGPGMDEVIMAVAGEQRLDPKPDIPTLKESGVNVVCSVWVGIYGPANMPPAIVQKINAAIEAYLRKAEAREKLGAIGLRVIGGAPDKMTARVVEDRVRWVDIVARLSAEAPKQ
jgi:tripartite-type tricarboxylate transporter receptor subunit TctC